MGALNRHTGVEAQRRAFERARSGREGVIREKGAEEYGEFLRKREYVPGREDEIMREIFEEAREETLEFAFGQVGEGSCIGGEGVGEEWKRFVSGEIDELCLEAGREFEQDEQERRMRIVEKRVYLPGS
ncbi:hypothetical protein C0995_010881 [Termitomyces sp. Mi166|nr:hypothetical protein C0995_010881 [Termitomyces sp. Mi166\